MEHNLETLPDKYVITCFRCGYRFEGYTEKTEHCSECGFTICPDCGYCKCEMSPEEQQIIQAMWNTVCDLVLWWRDHGRYLKAELREKIPKDEQHSNSGYFCYACELTDFIKEILGDA